jgi:hypothetical protein
VCVCVCVCVNGLVCVCVDGLVCHAGRGAVLTDLASLASQYMGECAHGTV